VTAKRLTRAQLQEQLTGVTELKSAEIARLCNELSTMRSARDTANSVSLDLREKLDEVKERLAFAEAELQRAGGYIQRVQEDDVVREPLVETGDPEGEKQLVPKRKPTHFAMMSAARPMEQVNFESGGMMFRDCATERPAKRRHWVTYR
jgi:hypothetical protein